jgi:hypothetical protein
MGAVHKFQALGVNCFMKSTQVQEPNHSLFAASAKSLKICLQNQDSESSSRDLQATPEMFCEYKLVLLLCNTFNDSQLNDKGIHLNNSTSSHTLLKLVRLIILNSF